MSSSRWIYLVGRETEVLAAHLSVDDSGQVVFEPGEQYFDLLMQSIGKGVYWVSEKRGIGPNDGEDFLLAVDEMLGRSSQWLVSSDPLPASD